MIMIFFPCAIVFHQIMLIKTKALKISQIVYELTMPDRVSLQDRALIMGQIQQGAKQRDVAIRFGVSQGYISKLAQKFRRTNSVDNLPRTP